MPLMCFIVPTIVPMYLWGESFKCAFFVAALFRYTFTLNATWLVNSAAHMWGDRPYDKYVTSVLSLIQKSHFRDIQVNVEEDFIKIAINLSLNFYKITFSRYYLKMSTKFFVLFF